MFCPTYVIATEAEAFDGPCIVSRRQAGQRECLTSTYQFKRRCVENKRRKHKLVDGDLKPE